MAHLLRHDTFRKHYEVLGHTLVTARERAGETLLVHFSGPPSAVRGTTSYLIHKDHRGLNSQLTWDGDLHVGLAPDTAYFKVETPLPGTKTMSALIAHWAFSTKNVTSDVYLLNRAGHKPFGFMDRLKEAVTLPILDEYEDPVWHILSHPRDFCPDAADSPLQPLWSEGALQAWRLDTAQPAWLHVLRHATLLLETPAWQDRKPSKPSASPPLTPLS
jgi:hypothetical protein